MSPVSAPVRQKDRIQIIDSVRGIALLGILLMNIPFFANPDSYYNNLNVQNEYQGVNYIVWWIVVGFFGGTMRALFSMLFGAGAILLLGRLEKRKMEVTPADIYYRRLIVLFLFGLVNAFVFLWSGDILYMYAVCGLFLYPFRHVKPRYLLLVSLIFLLCISVKTAYHFYDLKEMRAAGEQALVLEKKGVRLNEAQTDARQKWTSYQNKNSVQALRKEADKQVQVIGKQGYFGVLGMTSGFSVDAERNFFYDLGFFDIMIFIFLGMALFKLGVLTGNRSKKFYWTLLGISLPLGVALALWQCSTLVSLRFDATRIFDHSPLSPNQPRRICLSLAYLSGIMLVFKYGLAKNMLGAFSRVGQMAFSNYLMQSIICAFLFYGFGFGLFGRLERYQEYYVVGCIWIVQIIFSNVWLQYYRFGPFEWLWRSLTYWKKQPMKRSLPEEEESSPTGAVPALA